VPLKIITPPLHHTPIGKAPYPLNYVFVPHKYDRKYGRKKVKDICVFIHLYTTLYLYMHGIRFCKYT